MASALVTPRYASRSSTGRHHRPVTDSDPMRAGIPTTARSNVVIGATVSWADEVLGTRRVTGPRTGPRVPRFAGTPLPLAALA